MNDPYLFDWTGSVSDEAYRAGYLDGQRDERERIAQAIEALPAAYIAAGVWEDPNADHDHDAWDSEPVIVRSWAARIARNGGRDE